MRINVLCTNPYTESLPMEDLSYLDADGKICGGIQGIIGPFSPSNKTVIVQVDTSPAMVAVIAATAIWSESEDKWGKPPTAKPSQAKQKRAKDFLKAHGHDADKGKWDEAEAMKESILALHQIRRQEYEAAR